MSELLKEVKEALEKASTEREWDTDGRTIEWKDGHPLKGTFRTIAVTEAIDSAGIRFENPNFVNDAHLIANAPQWLASLVSRLEEAEKTLEWYASESLYQGGFAYGGLDVYSPEVLEDGGKRARETLKLLKGDQHDQ